MNKPGTSPVAQRHRSHRRDGDQEGIMTPNCKLCGTRPAKRIHSDYLLAARTPVFCTQRCAKDWALVWSELLDESRWCDTHQDWDSCNEIAEQETPTNADT